MTQDKYRLSPGKWVEYPVATPDTRTMDQHVANACAMLDGREQPYPRVFKTVRVPWDEWRETNAK